MKHLNKFLVLPTLIIGLSLALGCNQLAPISNADLESASSFTTLEKPDRTAGMTKSGRTVIIPAHAIELAPGIFSLGTAFDNGRLVEGYAIIDYKKKFHHRPGHTRGGGDKVGKSSCFAFLSNGAKWKTAENYLVDGTNAAGLDPAFVAAMTSLNILKWEAASGKNILGIQVPGIVDGIDLIAPDGKNEVLFGDIGDAGAIGITIVWGFFSGPPRFRELVEMDQQYDDVDFAWSANGSPGTMDFENISAHEIGHGIGMGHPSDDCLDETMYRFAEFGETKKRSLEAGDITGVVKLYK